MNVLISADYQAMIREHAEASYPSECCGLLVGVRVGGVVTVRRAEPLPNEAAERGSRDRYRVAPSDYLRIDREARAQGLDVVGVYHSHPDAPAVPSAVDLAAAWPGYAYVIVPVERGAAGPWRVWTLAEDDDGRQLCEAGLSLSA